MIAPMSRPVSPPVMPPVIAVDPGTTHSGVVLYDPCVSEPVVGAWVLKNDDLRISLRAQTLGRGADLSGPHVLAVEMIASYGMPVGAETFDTCVWIGRFLEAWGGEYRLVYRREVKSALCGSMRAKDANVWQALLDRFGGKASAVGCKAKQGPLYSVKSHARSALAVAVAYCDAAREAS